jgi:hypothetical protein
MIAFDGNTLKCKGTVKGAAIRHSPVPSPNRIAEEIGRGERVRITRRQGDAICKS